MNTSGHPPQLAKWILSHLRYFSLEHLIQSDLEEEFQLQALCLIWRSHVEKLYENHIPEH